MGVEFYRPAQESLFEPTSALFVGTGERVMSFEGDAAREAFARIVRDGAFCALDVKRALQEVYPADGVDSRGRRAFRRGGCPLFRYRARGVFAQFQYEPL